VRTILSFLIFILICLIIGCNRLDNPIVAKAFHHNLYQSDLLKKIPYATSKEDSLLFMEQYVNDWVLKQTLIAYAKKELTQKEQDFDSQMKLYKEQLLINAFMQKITKDSSLFAVSLSEIIPSEINEAPEYREMVKLNYIKLSEPSKLYQKIKYLFFFEKDSSLICGNESNVFLGFR